MAGPGAIVASGAIHRDGPARFKLSLAAYSFRRYMAVVNGQPRRDEVAGRATTLFDFIDYCADIGLPGAELTSYYFAETGRDYLLRLRRHAFLQGITVSGTAVGNNFCLPPGEARERQIREVKEWIDRAAILGAPHIRIFAGSRGDLSHERAKTLCIEAIRECCDYAGERGIMLGLENHGGIVAEADDVLDIYATVNHPWFGINLDTGNFHTEDPYADLARCAPYAVNVQVKVEMAPRGQPRRPADFGRLVHLLAAADYRGFVALEHEANENPWTTIPLYMQELKHHMQSL